MARAGDESTCVFTFISSFFFPFHLFTILACWSCEFAPELSRQLEEGKSTIGAWESLVAGRGMGGPRERKGTRRKGGSVRRQLITAFSEIPFVNCRYRESSDCHLTIHIT